MRRLRKNTATSMVLGGLSIVCFVLFGMSGALVIAVLAVVLLVASGFARKRESYDDYRKRYEEEFGLDGDTTERRRGKKLS
jgi:hypothetical protein